MMSSAQVGKTEIVNNAIGYHIAQDPCPILVLQPTLEMAEAWSKDRLAPMLRDTPALSGRVSDPSSRKSGNTLRHKIFPGGHITMSGANSPASLASRPIRFLACDEVDRYPVSAGTEGDPVSLARKRAATFWNRRILMTSTPTVKGASRIEHAWNLSTQERYYVPCPFCGVSQRLRWSQVKWDRDEEESSLPETARYECEACAEPWTDAERWSVLEGGKWIAEHPGRRVRGFHLSEIYSPWVELSQMVSGFLEAKRLPETLKTWVNTSLGETWEDAGDGVDHSFLYKTRREDYTVAPERAIVVTCGVDVQKDRIECEAVAWAPDLESWSLEYRQFYGDPLQADIWTHLDAYLNTTFPHESGSDLTINATCIDSGGHHTDEVYKFCKARFGKRVFAVKGRGGAGLAPIVMRSKNNRRKVTLFTLGVDTIKSNLFSRLEIQKPGPGYCHFREEYDESYFQGLCSEQAFTRYVRGQPTIVWTKKPHARNEPLDCRVYAMAALDILNPRWEAFEERYSPDAAQAEPQPEPKNLAVNPRATKPPRKNWVTNWR